MKDTKLKVKCVECESDAVYYDKHRAEIYCSKCGLVLFSSNGTVSHNLLEYDFIDYKEVSI